MTESVILPFALHEAALILAVYEDLYLKLYTNNYTPASSMTPASFTEASGGGYVQKRLEGIAPNSIAIDIEGLSRASECVVTWTDHGLISGNKITLASIIQTDWTALNAEHTITYINSSTFSIPINTSGYAGDYVPGTDPGTIQETTLSNWTLESNDPRDIIAPEQTFIFSGLLDGSATIYGWYFITLDGLTIKAAKRLDSPYVPASGGGTLKFTPRIQAGNGIPE